MPNECPSSAMLAQYATGELSEAEAAVVDTHIGCCTTCLERMNGLETGEDSVLAALRQMPRKPSSDSESLSRAIAASLHRSKSSAAPGLERGAELSGYRIVEELGRGGMGRVYRAAHPRLDQEVALKVLRPGLDSAPILARFEAERQALARMDHPNIARVLDGGATIEGQPFFAMELVRGVAVTRYCDENSLDVRRRLELFASICRAVQHAHQKGIIHRDLKPSNVLIAEYDGRPTVKVIDFGVAKATDRPADVETEVGVLVGTPESMSPEQANLTGQDIDTRTDVYGLGGILYELLTGDTPFERRRLRAAPILEVLRIVREEEPAAPSARLAGAESIAEIAARRGTEPGPLVHRMRGDLDWIVQKSIGKDRNSRYDSASALADDIERYLNDEPVLACPPSAMYRFRKFARRNKGKLAAALVLCTALVVAVSAIGWAVRDRSAQREQVELAQSERKARTLGQVQLIQQEVALLLREQKWSAALNAARRASDLVQGAEVDADVAASVNETRRALEFVKLLEEIRSDKSEWTAGGFANRRAAERYAAAFRGQGIDVEHSSPQEAAERLLVQPDLLPAIAPALHEWAVCHSAAGDLQRGGRVFDVAEIVDPEPFRQRLRRALRTKDAPAVFELAKSPDLARQPAATLANLSIALRILGRVDDAIDVLSGARLQHPNDFWVHFDLAQAFDRKRPPNYEQSVHCYRAALAIRPDSKAVWNNLGIALRRLGRLAEAVDCLNKAIELDSDFAIAYTNLAQTYLDQKKLDPAIAAFRKCIELNPNIPSAHNDLGVALTQQNKWDDAAECFRQAIAVDDQNAEAHGNLGNCYTKQRKFDDAVACYQKSLSIHPNREKIVLNLAGVLQLQGKSDASIEHFRKVIALNPKHSGAHIQLARCLCNPENPALRNPEEALRSAKLAVELAPQSMSAWLAMGLANYRVGDWKASIAALEKSLALQTDPKSGDALRWFFLAMAHRQIGDPDEARRWYDRAIEWMDKNPPVKDELRRTRIEAEEVLQITRD